MNQGLRNKIYAVATGIFGILVILGIIDEATSAEAGTLLESAMGVLDQALAMGVSLIAFIKSLPSRTTTLDIPRDDVVSVGVRGGDSSYTV